jgi:hypothetical protein
VKKEQFEQLQSIDDDLRKAVLEANGGRPPDNFIEDAQGGGVDSELLARRDPEADELLIEALDDELEKLGADRPKHGHVRYD